MILTKKDALEYVRGLFPGADVQLCEIYSGEAEFRAAQISDKCHIDCSGIERCESHGWRRRVHEDTLWGRRIFVVKSEACENIAAVMEQKRSQNLLIASRIPEELLVHGFENYNAVNDSVKAAKAIAMHCAQHGESLVLGGPTGVGKTHLAISIARRALSDGYSALFIPMVNLLDELRDAQLQNRVDNVMKGLRDVDCLVLDDVGTHKDSLWAGEKVYKLVNDRYNEKKQMIITTNAVDMVELESKFGTNGKPIVSRLREIALSFFILGNDYRMKKAGKYKQKDMGLEEVA